MIFLLLLHHFISTFCCPQLKRNVRDSVDQTIDDDLVLWTAERMKNEPNSLK